LFGLGALLYLADAEKNRQVTSIASVSGGSLTNGYVAQSADFSSVTGEVFAETMAPLVCRVAVKGTLWAGPLTWAYVVLLAVLVGGTFIGVWFLPIATGWQVLSFFGALAVLGWYAGFRSVVCSRAFAKTLFSPEGSPTLLEGINRKVDHVFCATDLHAGEHVYFSGRFVCAYRFGWGVPGGLPLHVAVQASAALPGAFPPRRLPTNRHGFVEPGDSAAAKTRWMALADGGVYDNMADQWPRDVPARNARWHDRNPGLHEPEEIVVVNSSAGLGWSALRRLWMPVMGELLALLRDKNVLYDNGTSVRRQSMVEQFDLAAREHTTPRGALVHIAASPFRAADRFAKEDANWPDRALRARAVLDALGNTPEHRQEWEDVATANSKVKTTLSSLGAPTSVRLLRHAYVLAMCNLHVILGYPLLKVPPQSKFEALLG